MENSNQLRDVLANYLKTYPGEQYALRSIHQFVQQFDGAALYSRNNFVGHITASAFIVNDSFEQVLMIDHTSLKRWLQPGGHVEASDTNIFAASVREAAEETGLPASALQSDGLVFDIDSHDIPANQRKQEPAHIHHDIRYLFTCDFPTELIVRKDEVSGCKWIAMDELAAQPGFQRVYDKLSALKIKP